MYEGKETKRIIKAKKEYEKMFGYDPDGELGVEFGDEQEYYLALKQCVEEKIELANLYPYGYLDEE